LRTGDWHLRRDGPRLFQPPPDVANIGASIANGNYLFGGSETHDSFGPSSVRVIETATSAMEVNLPTNLDANEI
jgi:hypothetical protein